MQETHASGAKSSPPRAAQVNGQLDVTVIGSGIAGSTTAALLAHAGLRVTIVEQASTPGGYAHAFHRGDQGQYTFDPAVHLVADQALFDGTLELLGVRDLCNFIPSEHFYRAVLPDFAIDDPATPEGFVEARGGVPARGAGDPRLLEAVPPGASRGARDARVLSLAQLDDAVAKAPALFRYRKATLARVLDEYFDDDRVKAVCGVPWYLGVPPSKASFQTFAQLTTVHTDSLFAVEGGVQKPSTRSSPRSSVAAASCC